MQDNLFYLIDKNIIKENIIEESKKKAINIDSVIDGRSEFYSLGNDIISIAHKCGINYVLVNTVKDALKLRKYNDSINIIVKYFDKEYIFDAIVNNIIFTIYSYKEFDELSSLNIKDDFNVCVYVYDGIEGFDGLSKLDKYLEEIKHMKIIGAYTEIQSKKIDNKRFEYFEDILSDLSNINKFVISDVQYDTNTNFFGKYNYINDYNKIVSLVGTIKLNRKIFKNDIFLDKRVGKDKVYSVIDFPYDLLIKRVFIKKKIYKVISYYNDKLIIENPDELKVRTHVEILGGCSKNDINSFLNLPGIQKNYLSGSSIEPSKFN